MPAKQPRSAHALMRIVGGLGAALSVASMPAEAQTAKPQGGGATKGIVRPNCNATKKRVVTPNCDLSKKGAAPIKGGPAKQPIVRPNCTLPKKGIVRPNCNLPRKAKGSRP